jgi:hypothetical protein
MRSAFRAHSSLFAYIGQYHLRRRAGDCQSPEKVNVSKTLIFGRFEFSPFALTFFLKITKTFLTSENAFTSGFLE